jgi:hypothetical protein
MLIQLYASKKYERVMLSIKGLKLRSCGNLLFHFDVGDAEAAAVLWPESVESCAARVESVGRKGDV